MKEVLKYYSKSVVSDRVVFKLAVLRRLRGNSSTTFSEEQELSNKAAFLLEVLELNKLVNLLDETRILATIPRP